MDENIKYSDFGEQAEPFYVPLDMVDDGKKEKISE